MIEHALWPSHFIIICNTGVTEAARLTEIRQATHAGKPFGKSRLSRVHLLPAIFTYVHGHIQHPTVVSPPSEQDPTFLERFPDSGQAICLAIDMTSWRIHVGNRPLVER